MFLCGGSRGEYVSQASDAKAAAKEYLRTMQRRDQVKLAQVDVLDLDLACPVLQTSAAYILNATRPVAAADAPTERYAVVDDRAGQVILAASASIAAVKFLREHGARGILTVFRLSDETLQAAKRTSFRRAELVG
jgi:hypothetical protein